MTESAKKRDGGAGLPLEARKELAARVLECLRERYPASKTHLTAKSPWELLVATVLAAQCTDARVNLVTPGLFARWPGPADLAAAPLAELEECIRSTGFFHNKAKHLKAAGKRVTEVYGGEVPRVMEDLITLPGVARKTANVVLWGAYGINEGLAVDTHVGRIAFRLGLARTRDPLRTEQELTAVFPRDEWGDVNHRMVWYGREICRARSPLCEECGLLAFCAKRGLSAE